MRKLLDARCGKGRWEGERGGRLWGGVDDGESGSNGAEGSSVRRGRETCEMEGAGQGLEKVSEARGDVKGDGGDEKCKMLTKQ